MALSYRFGVDRGHHTRLAASGLGQFLEAVCAVLSAKRYESGRYVCASPAHRGMEAVGLAYDDATLTRIGKTLPEWLRDTAFLNGALKAVFQSPPLPNDGQVAPIGWGGDAGYADFVEFAFRVFGQRVESLYLGFFLLLATSTALICVQFRNNHVALFAVLSFHYSIFLFLNLFLNSFQVYYANNPRFLSLLAILPALHALFLMAHRIPATGLVVSLFAVQSILMFAAGHVRSLAFTVVIALYLYCALLLGVSLWRREVPARDLLRRYWPCLVLFLCIAVGFFVAGSAADRRLALVGGMRGHTFWEPLYYNLQQHPDWKRKYGEEHEGATGDATAHVAVQHYRKRHGLLKHRKDYLMGDETLGITQRAYEKYTRIVFLEFVRKDPWYYLELKYYNVVTVIQLLKVMISGAWAASAWQFWMVAAYVILGLVMQVRSKAESLSVLTWSTAGVVSTAILIACPIWLMVVNHDLMTDSLIAASLASFVVAVWGGVVVGVMIGRGADAFQKALRQSR